ncbi:MAG: hypothetical protein SGPRY_014655, partial [Prymnesium sp.]
MLTDAASKRQRLAEVSSTCSLRATVREARVIVLVIWMQISVGALFLVACAATVGVVRSKGLFLLLLFGGVFFTFGSSAGISRA